MKSFFSGFLIIGVLSIRVGAECNYFRVSFKKLTCGPADEKTQKEINPYQPVQDSPELQDPVSQNLLQVTCECVYSLQGSDPRCDMDQTVEKSSVIGADDFEHTCRRGNSICHDVCPANLP